MNSIGKVSRDIKHTTNFSQQKVKVHFEKESLMKENIASAFKTFKNPHIILWFLGRKGCRQPWASFLCEDIIKPIRNLNNGAKFHLCDLTSWEDFKTKKDPTKPQNSKVINKINSLKCQDVTILPSAEFFKFLKQGTNTKNLDYVKNTVWKREWIWEESTKNFVSAGKALGTLGANFAYFQTILDMDCSLAYSGLQYLEACFYTEYTANQGNNEDKEIVFLLPNDECKYYQDAENSIEVDLNEMMNNTPYFKHHKSLNVHFIPFVWGTDKSDRPYLSSASAANLETFSSIQV